MTKKTTKTPAKKTPAKAQLVEQVAEKERPDEEAGPAGGRRGDGRHRRGPIRQGQSVGLPGVGTLSVKATAARTGVKPGNHRAHPDSCRHESRLQGGELQGVGGALDAWKEDGAAQQAVGSFGPQR